MLRYPFLILVITLVVCFGCHKDQEVSPAQEPYSFFVAGHTYGRPGVNNVGLHPRFKKHFQLINTDSLIRFGVLTGDIVHSSTTKDWDEVERDLQMLHMPVYFVAGNHDVRDRDLYEARYGRTYYSFEYESDLFIVLDPGLDGWNIKGDQWQFLEEKVESYNGSRVFIFFHHLLWWSRDNKFKNERPNSTVGRSDSINFYSEVEPFLHQQPMDIYMVAGDIGVSKQGTGYFYYQYDNITLVASGMGAGPTDNFVIVDVLPDGEVDFRLIALWGDDIHALGDLEDYELR